jgi:glycosyltransferase involved in cell wall biosynthesis
MPIKALGLALYGSQAASTRYRLTQYVPLLHNEGIDLQVESLLGNDYIKRTFAGQKYPLWHILRDYLGRVELLLRQHSYDVAIVHYELFPLLPGIIESRLLRIPYIYDFDDALFLKYRSDRFKRVSFFLQDKFDLVLSRAAAVTAGNHYLADYAKRWNPATQLLPTVVDTDRYIHSPNKREDVFTVGWIGSPSTSVYLSELRQPLAQLGQEGPVRFVVVGGHSAAIEQVEVVNMPWSEETEVTVINTFDVGVMPLFDDQWARGKCAFKLIQYMACGVPVVASPVGANVHVVDGACGLLPGGPQAWLDALRRLRDDRALRQSMGTAGRRRVEQLYSLRNTLPIMVDTIKASAAKRRDG